MKTFLGIKYSLDLLPEQKLFIAINCGNQRFLFNSLWGKIHDKNLLEKIPYEKNFNTLDENNKRIRELRSTSGYCFEEDYLRKLFYELRIEFPFLSFSNSSSLQYTISYLSQAVKDGINPKNKKKMPKFKKRILVMILSN